MTLRKSILAFVLSLLTSLTCLAQSPQQTPTPQSLPPPPPAPVKVDQDDVVKITTNLVQVDAVVTKDGKPVRDLKADDFEIFEDGHKQQISSFAYISNVPGLTGTPVSDVRDKNSTPIPTQPLRPNDPRRVIALVVDDLGLSAESMGSVKKQLRKFVNEQIGPNDLVAILRTGGTLGALQQFTNDRRLIDAALNQVKWNICSRVGTSVLPPVGGLVPLNMSSPCGMSASSIIGTLRSLRFIVEAMGEIPGRKSMVLFSDSLPREEQDFTNELTRTEDIPQSSEDTTRNFGYLLQRVAEKAIRSSVVIYAVDAGGLQYTGITAADDFSRMSSRQLNQTVRNTMNSRSLLIQQRREGAELIAKETGGFLVRNSNDFQLDRVLEDQSGYYLIGYRPTDETFNRKFHHIKARVKKSGMTLRTRYGFFGVSEEEVARSKRTPVDKTMVALLSPFRAQELALDLNAFFTNDKSGSYIRLFAVLNAKDLMFRETTEGWREATIQLREIIVGNNGAVADQQTFDRTISLRGDTYEQALREGIMFHLDLPVRRPGAYQVRVAARDVATSKVGAVGQFVEIPDLNNGQLALSGIVLTDGNSSNAKEEKVSPTARRFPIGSNVRFGFGIYNALIDPASHQPNVTLQIQLYRDGKQVFSSPIIPVDTKKQADLARIVTTGLLSLNPDLEPGPYYLQIIVSDALAKEKHSPAVQWIDFEIVK